MKVTLNFSESCPICEFKNLIIYGTRINGETKISIKCMRCGNKFEKGNIQTNMEDNKGP